MCQLARLCHQWTGWMSGYQTALKKKKNNNLYRFNNTNVTFISLESKSRNAALDFSRSQFDV